MSVSLQEAQAMVVQADQDGNGRISFGEFANCVAKTTDDAKWQITWVKTWRDEAQKNAAAMKHMPLVSAARQDPRSILSKKDIEKYRKLRRGAPGRNTSSFVGKGSLFAA